jgi:hypothetical protein
VALGSTEQRIEFQSLSITEVCEIAEQVCYGDIQAVRFRQAGISLELGNGSTGPLCADNVLGRLLQVSLYCHFRLHGRHSLAATQHEIQDSRIGQCSSLEHSGVLCKGKLLHVPKGSRGKNIVGRRVAEARRLLQPPLTQDALSGRVARRGVQLDRAAIAKIENGHRRVLDYELKALATALGVQVSWLLGDEM